ncbi:MAG: hypothetical protein LBT00_14815 [Spirochaetaceae bacterium]|nr:hypothetical protein [Spirochaetaceae bacterium]
MPLATKQSRRERLSTGLLRFARNDGWLARNRGTVVIARRRRATFGSQAVSDEAIQTGKAGKRFALPSGLLRSAMCRPVAARSQ